MEFEGSQRILRVPNEVPRMVEISSNVKFFKLYPVGREAISWGSIRASRSLILQLTDKIFLAREVMGDVPSASLMRVSSSHALIK